MVVQEAHSYGRGTLPPPGFKTPLWEVLADEWKSFPPPVSETVTLGPGILVMGHNDCESDDILPDFEHQHAGHEFGWDNESPRREIMVEKFKIDTRPITNGDFYDFWKQNKTVSMPVSWLEESGKIKVRSFRLSLG
jgi:formylglycine-generating enzyme required for sulfatase activity